MKIEEKKVTFPKSLSVKYAGKIVEETDTHLTLEGEDEESYLKIFNPFRGVAKLLMFENDQRPPWLNWVFLAIFLWSSWQLLGFWLPQIQG